MPVTLFVLANTLIFHDEDADCPFCKKTEWGEEKHDKDCPFGLAYLALKEHAQQSVQRTVEIFPQIGSLEQSNNVNKLETNMDEKLKEAVDLLTQMRWTSNTKELYDRVEKFVWEQRKAAQQGVHVEEKTTGECPECHADFLEDHKIGCSAYNPTTDKIS